MLVASASRCIAQHQADCTAADYKIVTTTLLAVQCNEEVPGRSGTGQLLASDNPTPVATAKIRSYYEAAQWLIVNLTPIGPGRNVLISGRKYRLIITLSLSHTTPPVPTTLDVAVDSTIQVSPVNAVGVHTKFEFASHVGFRSGPDGRCILQTENFDRRLRSLKARCRLPAPIPANATDDTLPRRAPSPEDIGSLFVTLGNDKDAQALPYAVPGLLDVFGNAVKIDMKGQIASSKAPASKDAADYYVNFNHAAAVGSKPAWTLNTKIAPPLGGLHRGFQFSPLASTDIGQNQITGIKYADTIDFGASMSRILELKGILHGLLVRPGVTYETDKEFDRHNLMATPDLKYYFPHLYNTQRRRTMEKYARELAIAQCTAQPPIPNCTPLPWSVENSKPALWGYALDVHTGTELGGALKDTVVKASVGGATQLLPSYQIARFVPAVHALLEIQRFSIDEVATARYLAAAENTVTETKDHSLNLRTVQGWLAYNVVTGAYNLDPVGRFALSLCYKNGFSPPQFQRINVVQTGITFKY